MPRGVTVGTCGSAPSPHTIGSWSFWLFSIPRRTGLETSSGDWIPASSENSHAASTIPRCGPTSTALTRHRRTRTGSRPIAIRATSYGRDLLRWARLLPQENGRCRSCGLTWVACSSSRCSPSSCVGTIRTCCSFVRRSTSKVGICWYSSLAPHVLTSRKSRARPPAWGTTESASMSVAIRSCRQTTSCARSSTGIAGATRASRSAGWSRRSSWLGGRRTSGMRATSPWTRTWTDPAIIGPNSGTPSRIRPTSFAEPSMTNMPRRDLRSKRESGVRHTHNGELRVRAGSVERKIRDVEGALVEDEAGGEVEIVLADSVVAGDQLAARREHLDLTGQSWSGVLGGIGADVQVAMGVEHDPIRAVQCLRRLLAGVDGRPRGKQLQRTGTAVLLYRNPIDLAVRRRGHIKKALIAIERQAVGAERW